MSTETGPIADPLLPTSIERTIEKAREAGQVSADDLVNALEGVELSPDLIETVMNRLRDEAVHLDGDFEVPVIAESAVPQRRERSGSVSAISSLVDPIRAYLQSIAGIPLLDADEERRLAEVVALGQLASEKLKAMSRMMEPPPRSELLELQRQLTEGAQARTRIVESNLRLVVSIAKRYRHRGISFLDLIQEGNAGLVRAVEKFDVTKGFRVSTYATWWIRQAMSRCVADQARMIRIPVHVYETLSRVLTVQRAMLQEHGREPSFEELAQRVQMSAERVRDILSIDRSTVSLEPNDEGYGLGNLIGDADAEQPDQIADRNALMKLLHEAMNELDDRERDLMMLRFGLEDNQPRTLEEVGQIFGVTRERVRQIEARTFAKLRTPAARRQLEAFLEE